VRCRLTLVLVSLALTGCPPKEPEEPKDCRDEAYDANTWDGVGTHECTHPDHELVIVSDRFVKCVCRSKERR